MQKSPIEVDQKTRNKLELGHLSTFLPPNIFILASFLLFSMSDNAHVLFCLLVIYVSAFHLVATTGVLPASSSRFPVF